MAEQFYTILTNAGKAAIANASALGTKVDFKNMALGDGNGNYYNPTENQTQLVKEVYRSQINHVQIDTDNPNWINLTMVLAGSIGGFTVREAGVFDTEGNLLVIGKYPETYKPSIADGSSKDLTINLIMEVSNSSVVTLKIDPSVILATKAELDVLRQQLIDYKDELGRHKAEKATQDEYGHIKLSDIPSLEIATESEAVKGADNTKMMTPLRVKNFFENMIRPDDPTDSPGNKYLLWGDSNAGYFGEVLASELITGDTLASKIGLSAGTSQFSSEPWLKFVYKNKILFIAKKPLRAGVNWNHINAANAVYGEKTVDIGGLIYKIRLIKGALTDPNANDSTDKGAKYSEWNRLMLPIHAEAKDKSWGYNEYVEDDIPYWRTNFTNTDLHLTNATICQETRGPSSSDDFRVTRGSGSISALGYSGRAVAGSSGGWRPVLEVSE